MQKTLELTDTALEVLKGLKAPKKYISSKYFYDAEGSRIFQDIMQMPEYYPTGCEAEIFGTYKRRIGSLFCNGCSGVDLVELGAGDGQKTRILIRSLLDDQVNFRYIPVDISEEAVAQLEKSMKQQFPELSMVTRIGDYFHMIEELSREFPNRKVVMFLGSNLGNFNRQQSISFLSKLNLAMSKDDLFFIGLDLKKDPRVIRSAYDDPYGYTRDFNLNLLKRINRELGADFNPDHFLHVPHYDPESGAAKSYLVSTRDQTVRLANLDDTIHFRKWETIYTEMSQKYDMDMIHDLADASGFRVVENLFDSRQYFVNSLWKKLP